MPPSESLDVRKVISLFSENNKRKPSTMDGVTSYLSRNSSYMEEVEERERDRGSLAIEQNAEEFQNGVVCRAWYMRKKDI